MFKLKKFLRHLGFIVPGLIFSSVILNSPAGEQEPEPRKGIKIVLTVYSGRPNPQWWLTSGRDFEKLVQHLRELKTEDKEVFDYNKWNRLGYATFWIFPRNIEGLPYAVHIWRDMASIIQSKGAKPVQAIGMTPIYDILVAQAIEKKEGKFFQTYLKFKETQKKKKSNN